MYKQNRDYFDKKKQWLLVKRALNDFYSCKLTVDLGQAYYIIANLWVHHIFGWHQKYFQLLAIGYICHIVAVWLGGKSVDSFETKWSAKEG